LEEKSWNTKADFKVIAERVREIEIGLALLSPDAGAEVCPT